ncbi:MAG: iron reductase [Leptolyngbyaceae cyanobacterium CSU_1_3]|nr:iron reductase [Leptolyngbyaceae cyanobacterium CSU_1_3]
MTIALDIPPLANSLGFAALIGYSLTLLPSILRIVFPQSKGTTLHKWLLQYRRHIGVLSLFLSALHGYPYLHKRSLDAGDMMTYLIYIQGVLAFVILILLAATSNNWSMKKLKKNWKQLHKLTYALMFLLIWHIWDKMSGHWTYLTPVGLGVMTGATILFLIRAYTEYETQRQKDLEKATSLTISEK